MPSSTGPGHKNSVDQFHLLLGTLISSVGSQCLFIVMTVLMPFAGFSIFEVGIFVAVGRLSTLLANFFLGEISNRFSPRAVILFSESLGIIATVGIYFTWVAGKKAFAVLAAWMFLRSFALAIQAPSRARMLKAWTIDDTDSQIRGAIWLNKATQGSLLFAAILSAPLIMLKDIRYAIVLDLVTFAVNGWLLYFRVRDNSDSAKDSSSTGFFGKLYLYFSKTPELWLLDLCLLTGTTGINTLFVKIAGVRSGIAPMLHVIFGGTVWLTGYMLRVPSFKKLEIVPWWTIAVGFGLLAVSQENSWFLAFPATLIFTSYWMLFHRYTAEIQIRYGIQEIAAVTSARMIQINLFVILGEFIVGLNERWISNAEELYLRCAFFTTIAIGLTFRKILRALQMQP